MRIQSIFSNYQMGNASGVTVRLLRSLGVPVTTKTAVDAVEHHPDYPSLLSISDSLRKWKIDNLAIEVEPDHLDYIPVPFIAHGRSNGGRFMLVTDVNGAIQYRDETGIRSKISREHFLKEWSGVALVAEKTPASGEQDYRKAKMKELLREMTIPFILVCCLGFVVLHYFLTPAFGIYAVATAMILLAGSIVSALLLWYDIDKANPLLKQFCSGSKQASCEAVLQSKHSRIFNGISWSEIGFFYFAGSFLALVTTPAAGVISLLALLNIVVLPYTIFSVYYQWRVVKQWCKLCLAIQGILVVQFLVNFLGYWSFSPPFVIDASQIVPVFLSFLLPVFFWISTKRVYLSAQQGKRDKKELIRLKYNKEVFNALLQKQKKITASTEGLGIVLGNPEAENTIIKVCSPYCSPCAKAHRILDKTLEENPNLKVQIIFTATNDDNDSKAAPVKHLMALYQKNDEGLIKDAMNSWYNAEKKDFQDFAAKYPINGELKMPGKELELMADWCKTIDISFTPTLFINGYQFPKEYKISDMRYVISIL